MCGICGEYRLDGSQPQLSSIHSMMDKLEKRGPDSSGSYSDGPLAFGHRRLSILDLTEKGNQPMIDPHLGLALVFNGTIYNHPELREQLTARGHQFFSTGDTEVIIKAYAEWGKDCVKRFLGMFAIAIWDLKKKTLFMARDRMGIKPLYYSFDKQGIRFASSMPAILSTPDVDTSLDAAALHNLFSLHAVVPAPRTIVNGVKKLEPAHSLTIHENGEHTLERYWELDATRPDTQKTEEEWIDEIHEALRVAVKRRNNISDVPVGVLLSGGLDSSITSAVAKRFAAMRIEDDEQSEAWWPQLHSFAVGLEGAPDLIAAREVADKIGTVHHEMTYTIQEGLDAIRDVIYHIETYDVTTIRASTPMYLLARKIKAMGIKMVLSGEGADEIFGGYLYFHKAPNAKEFHEETVRKLLALSMFDCARANKSLAAWGVEGRVPFLDKEFIDVAMRLNPEDKMCGNGKMEKHILRECFEDYLPDSIAWRQKEQFSDGVGYDWIDTLKATAEAKVTDQQMEAAKFRFPYNTPTTKEGYAYREIFEELFPLESAAECVPGGPSVACSSAKAIEWDESFKNCVDPSGRAVQAVHNDSY